MFSICNKKDGGLSVSPSVIIPQEKCAKLHSSFFFLGANFLLGPLAVGIPAVKAALCLRRPIHTVAVEPLLAALTHDHISVRVERVLALTVHGDDIWSEVPRLWVIVETGIKIHVVDGIEVLVIF